MFYLKGDSSLYNWGNFNPETEWTFKCTGQQKRLSRDQKVCCCLVDKSYPTVIPRTVAHQAPLCMRFSRQEYWSGLPWLSPGDLLDSGIEPMFLMSPALGGRFFTTCATWEAPFHQYHFMAKHSDGFSSKCYSHTSSSFKCSSKAFSSQYSKITSSRFTKTFILKKIILKVQFSIYLDFQ